MPTPAGPDLPPPVPPDGDGAAEAFVRLTAADDQPTVISPGRPPGEADAGVPVGSTLGGFEVVGSAGAGGMAAVLKAHDPELGRTVALKILPTAMARDPDAVARFKLEARAAARLDHDNVARVFACGEDRGRHFIAFEFVAGDNLRTLIDRRGPLPAGECVRYMVQVAAGLAHAAGRGVVHRDIKPSNIVVTPDGRAKIVDMGLARNLDQPANGGVTQSGVTLGTFDYISPEQALDPRRADVRSDIYSLGCAFYHALTGRPPVPDGTAARKLSAHQNDPILDPRVINPAVPDGLAAVLSRMMMKDPARRYQTPAELIADLAALAPQLGLSAETLALDPALVPTPGLRPGGGPPAVPLALVAGLAAVAVAVAAAVGMFPANGDKSRMRERPGSSYEPFEPNGAVAKLPTADEPPPAPIPPPPPASLVTVATADQLAQALENPAVTDIRLEAGRRYDMAALAGGVVAAAPRLTLAAAGPGTPPVVRLATGAADARRPSLVVDRAASVTFRGIHFEIVDGGDPTAGRPAGLLIAAAGRVEFAGCRFESSDPEQTTPDAAVIAVTAHWAGAAVVVTNCLFGPRPGVGLVVAGPARVDVRESAFGAHVAAIALRAAADDPAAVPELHLTNCSFMIETGSAVEAAGPSVVTTALCLFAGPPADPAAQAPAGPVEARPAAVRSVHAAPAAATVTGRPDAPSAYYLVDVSSTPSQVVTVAAARAAGDAGAVDCPAAPWAVPDPRPLIAGARPWEAFRLNTTLPAVRARPPVLVVGAKELAGEKLYNPWPPPAPPATATRVRIVDPDPPTGPDAARTYRTIEAAVADARPDDEIHIRHDGPLEVGQTTIDRQAKAALTIRPYPGSAPVLVAAVDSNKADDSLFRLVEGQLTLDGLDFRLNPRAGRVGETRALAVVTVVAGRAVTLRNCTVTFAGADPDQLAAVALADPDGEMRAGTTAPPAVTVERSLIRGAGAGVRVPAARPFDFDAKNSVFALAGPVVGIGPPARTPARAAVARARFDQVTAVLGGPLVQLDAGRPAAGAAAIGWVPVQVTASRCLFAALDAPAVTIDGGDPAALAATLAWKAERPNAYANFDPKAAWMEVTPPAEMPAVKRYAAADWFAFTGEDPASAGPVPFRAAPMSSRQFAGVDAADLAAGPSKVPAAADAGAQTGEVAHPGGR